MCERSSRVRTACNNFQQHLLDCGLCCWCRSHRKRHSSKREHLPHRLQRRRTKKELPRTTVLERSRGQHPSLRARRATRTSHEYGWATQTPTRVTLQPHERASHTKPRPRGMGGGEGSDRPGLPPLSARPPVVRQRPQTSTTVHRHVTDLLSPPPRTTPPPSLHRYEHGRICRVGLSVPSIMYRLSVLSVHPSLRHVSVSVLCACIFRPSTRSPSFLHKHLTDTHSHIVFSLPSPPLTFES